MPLSFGGPCSVDADKSSKRWLKIRGNAAHHEPMMPFTGEFKDTDLKN
jgi:hypothetical protein